MENEGKAPPPPATKSDSDLDARSQLKLIGTLSELAIRKSDEETKQRSWQSRFVALGVAFSMFLGGAGGATLFEAHDTATPKTQMADSLTADQLRQVIAVVQASTVRAEVPVESPTADPKGRQNQERESQSHGGHPPPSRCFCVSNTSSATLVCTLATECTTEVARACETLFKGHRCAAME